MKKLLKVMTIALMVVALTGCMKLNVNIEVKSDKTMTMGMEILAEESMFEGSGTTAEEYVNQVKEKVLSTKGFEDAVVSPVTKTIDENKWLGVNIEKTGISEGSLILAEKEIDGVKSLVLTLPMNSLSEEMDMSSLENYGYSASTLKAVGVEMNVNIKMPADATANVGSVDGKLVVVDLLDLMTNKQIENIVISSPISNGMDLTFVFIGVGIIVIVGIVFFMLKKKKKPTEEVNDGTPIQKTSTKENVLENNEESNEENTETVQPTKKYCPNCGAEVNEEETCSNCGYSLKK